MIRATARLAGAWTLAALTTAACGKGPAAPVRSRSEMTAHVAPAGGKETQSNVLRSDYAGSAACRPCHASLVASWERSPMHRMTRLAASADILAPFDGEALHFKADTATMERRANARFVRLEGKGAPPQLYRVTRVLGGHHREDFVGVPVADYRDAGKGQAEMVLPVSYLSWSKSLRYKGYSVMVHERPGLEAGPVWSRTCIFCHNTTPYLSTLLGGLAGGRAPRYQGELVDTLLPDDRRWTYEVTDEGALRRALDAEIAKLGGEARSGGDRRRRVLDAIDVTRDRFTGDALLEVGIGCESCHGGAREHVEEPTALPSFEPRAPFLEVQAPYAREPEHAHAQQVNHVCARCHQVLFSHYPWTWEGGQRHALPGGSHISSGEGRDFLLGACAGAMSCTACHDPHASGEADARLRVAQGPAGNGVCLACHGELRTPEAQRAHSHHAPEGAAGACIACHMPRKNMSLESRLSRYHRIGSPTDPLRVLGDRPLECALCHADQTVEKLVTTMERWWNKAYDRDALLRLYGDLSSNVLLATLHRGKPHEQAVALATLGEHPRRDLAPLVARELANEYPLVREFASEALDRALGAPCDVPLAAELAVLEQRADRCLAAAGMPPVAWPALPPASLPGEAPED